MVHVTSVSSYYFLQLIYFEIFYMAMRLVSARIDGDISNDIKHHKKRKLNFKNIISLGGQTTNVWE